MKEYTDAERLDALAQHPDMLLTHRMEGTYFDAVHRGIFEWAIYSIETGPISEYRPTLREALDDLLTWMEEQKPDAKRTET